MAKGSKPGSGGVLEEAEEAFEQWRASREKRGRIPERLWSLAAEAAASDGTHRVARRLRLNPSRLKERMAQAGRTGQGPSSDEAAEGTSRDIPPGPSNRITRWPASPGPLRVGVP